jgi:hypothetical protein
MGAYSEPRTGSAVLVLLKRPADARARDAFFNRYGSLILRCCRRHKPWVAGAAVLLAAVAVGPAVVAGLLERSRLCLQLATSREVGYSRDCHLHSQRSLRGMP